MRNTTRHLLVSSNLAGNLDALNQLITVARESNVDAILLTGNLTAKQDGVKGYRELFKMLAHANLPSFYIPGPNDFPVQPYLFETASIEVVFPYLHGVHGTFAFAPGHILVCGMGGEIIDAAETEREEKQALRYPGWEAVYRLKFLQEMRDYPKIFLFTTPPAHKGFRQAGSESIAELIGTYKPRLAVAEGKEFRKEWIGHSLIVIPGHLSEGNYALVNWEEQQAESRKL
jgi:Icc-related predicted phosphoesterase